MEQYNSGEHYNGVLVLPLRKFRQICKDVGLLDRVEGYVVSPITVGDINVTYQVRKKEGGDATRMRTSIDTIQQIL